MRLRGKVRLAIGMLAAAPLLLMTACAQDLPQNSLAPQGPVARKIDALFNPVFWIAAAVFVFVEGLIVVIAVRFRHREGAGVPKQVHGNKRLELTWTIIPSLILAGVAVPTIGTIFALAAKPAGNVLEITVTGHQWWWEAQYPSLHVTTANEIHIPAGRPVYITLESKDVIHSFWIPRLAGKQDLEPGRTNHLTIEADNPGEYWGQCAEYCGISHANMRMRVIAQGEADFTAWASAEAQPAGPAPPDALQVMQSVGCGGCHTIDGVEGFAGVIGPNLTHFGSRKMFAGATEDNTPANLAAWLSDPQAVKPGNDMVIRRLSPQEIDTLVQYLESLK
jgi:cytochrome c oxidase subunit 2